MYRDVRMADLIEANPALEQHMRDWQTERHHRGEHPFDWPVFRAVMRSLGGNDPGESPPSEFYWFTPPDGTHPLMPERHVEASAVPSARLVTPGDHLAGDPPAEHRSATLTDMKYWR